jgi:hypothetical protein
MHRAGIFVLMASCAFGKATPQNVERVVFIGDNVASSPTLATSYATLLEKNDDALFPEFAGKDLRSRVKHLRTVRLDRGGDSFQGVAGNLKSVCTCTGDACKKQPEPCLDTGDGTATLLIIELGVNDVVAGALRLVSDVGLRADPTPLLEDFRHAVHTLLNLAWDDGWFARRPLVYVTNVYDPSDGQGDIVAMAAKLLPLPAGATDVTPDMVRALMDQVNAIIADEAASSGATVIDVHAAFLGHGLHHGDDSLWIRGVIDPSLRGSHEIRRLVWNTFSADKVTDAPGPLPPDNTLGLPMVRDDAWAVAVVANNVAHEVDSPLLGKVPNTNDDVSWAIGKPDGNAVALGVVGNWIEVDLGREALDGDGADIVVMEQGLLSGGVPEPYRVLVADDPNGPFVRIGDGSGERAYDLADGGVASARYVRIESQSQPSDIGRVGSPFSPGPEIDGVGAVYPQ